MWDTTLGTDDLHRYLTVQLCLNRICSASLQKKPQHRIQMAAMEGGDWRALLPPDSRSRIVSKIAETLRRHVPVHGPEGLEEIRRIASRFEEKTYAQAQSQSDYLRRIALKMLTMESRAVGPNASSVAGGSSFNAPPYDEY